MGMFDSIYADCPRCGHSVEFQTKEGPLALERHDLESADAYMVLDVINDPHWCAGCKSWFALIDPEFPPGEPRKPKPKAVPVRDPEEGEFWTYQRDPDRHRWWNADFTFDDLEPARTNQEAS